jgi:hypothetical protein
MNGCANFTASRRRTAGSLATSSVTFSPNGLGDRATAMAGVGYLSAGDLAHCDARMVKERI